MDNITNYERIKNMSVEEMALFLENFMPCSRCRKRGNDCFPYFDIEKWLNSEVDDG